MKVTFVSNYINHHQIPFSDCMYQSLGTDFCFIQAEPMEAERIAMGWSVDLLKIPYLLLYYEKKEQCDKLLMESDIVIFGGTENEEIILPRLQAGKITLRNSERLYREGRYKAVSPRGLRKKYRDHTKYRNANVYLLCCGAYVAGDFNIVLSYPGKKLKWGYFPEFREQNEAMLPNETGNRSGAESLNILWAGRFLPLKHPDYAVIAAKRLRELGVEYHLTMIGDGEEKKRILSMIKEYGLEEKVTLTGFLSPDQVRCHMEKSQIFLFTSDQLEGWGAVLNEAMNSGCAVIANRAIGAVPFLIKNEINGMIYKNGSKKDFLCQTERVATDQKFRRVLGRNAYRTIADEWNPYEAAKRLLIFMEHLLDGKMETYTTGPVSPADFFLTHGR